MKHLHYAALTILISATFALSEEVYIGKPILMGKVPAKVKRYDDSTKTWGEADGFGYAFMLYLKNISEKPITVATGGLSQQTSSASPKQEVKLDMNKMTVLDGGALIVPSREELRLVELRPGEAAAMKIEFKLSVPLEEISVIYAPEDFYDGRFGYWTGKITSETTLVENKQ